MSRLQESTCPGTKLSKGSNSRTEYACLEKARIDRRSDCLSRSITGTISVWDVSWWKYTPKAVNLRRFLLALSGHISGKQYLGGEGFNKPAKHMGTPFRSASSREI